MALKMLVYFTLEKKKNRIFLIKYFIHEFHLLAFLATAPQATAT